MSINIKDNEAEMFNRKNIKKAILAPEDCFDKPEDVVLDQSLSREEKMTILDNWEDNQNALLTADAENMEQDQKRDHPSATIRHIQAAREKL